MKKLWLLGALCFALICLSGCAQEEVDFVKETEQDVEEGMSANWKENGFALEEISAAQELKGVDSEIYHEADYKELGGASLEFSYDSSCVATGYLADTVYNFYACQTVDGIRYALEKRQIIEDKSQVVDIQLPKEIATGYAVAVDVVSEDNIYVLFAENGENGKASRGMHILELDEQGNIQSSTKLGDEFVTQEEMYCSLFLVDEQGYSYIVNGLKTQLYLYDSAGRLVLQKEYADNAEDVVRGGFHTPDGSVILLVGNYNKATTDLVWYDMPALKPIIIQTLDAGAIPLAYMMDADYIYYLSTSRIYAWNVITGEQTKLYDCTFHNIDYSQIDCMTITSDSQVVLYCTQIGKTSAYILSDEMISVEEDDISLAFLASSDPYLKTTVADFSRKNSDMAITIEMDSGDKEAYHDRIMAELVAGKGPDMLWVNMEDMQILYDKGAIMPISELVKEETLNQVFSGILESGTIKEQLMGVYFDAAPICFVVNKELLDKDEWSVADLVDIATKHPELKGLMASPYDFNAATIFSILALNNLEASEFIDFKNHKSNFSSSTFIGLLNLLKQYGDAKTNSNVLEEVCDGEYLSYRTALEVRDLPGYSELMAQCEEDCQLMGFPGSGQYQGCWMQNYFLVVNASTENKEAISKFLEYAFSLEAQRDCTKGSVRKDVISTQVYMHEYLGTYVYGSGARELVLKENGDTYLEDYLAFLENCAPSPRSYEAIENIVEEEVEKFFDGTYTAEKVAQNIDNRVQLYLDEQN